MLAGLAPEAGVVVENEVDRLGGFGVLDTDAYQFIIKVAYVSKSKGGAVALNLHLETPTGAKLNQQFWMTSGTAKGGKNYYVKDGKQFYLPGFNQANAVSLLTIGREIFTLVPVTKQINLYDFNEKKEVPTDVDMLMDLIGQPFYGGVEKQLQDKNVQNPNFDPNMPINKNTNPMYVPSGETREVNEIVKVFRAADQLTASEIRGGTKVATFFPAWVKKMQGTVVNKCKKQTGVVAGAPSAGTTAAAPTKNLFG